VPGHKSEVGDVDGITGNSGGVLAAELQPERPTINTAGKGS